MHLVNSIYNNSMKSAHENFLRIQAYSEILRDLVMHIGIYPNKDEYIDFAIKQEFEMPIRKLIEMTDCNKIENYDD